MNHLPSLETTIDPEVAVTFQVFCPECRTTLAIDHARDGTHGRKRVDAHCELCGGAWCYLWSTPEPWWKKAVTYAWPWGRPPSRQEEPRLAVEASGQMRMWT